MNKSLKALDVIVRLLKGNCWYRIVGGYAIDGYLGCLSRPHNDIDIIILEEEIYSIQEVLRKNGYSFSLLNYKIHLLIDGVAIDLGRFQRDQESYWLVTLPDHKWPTSLLKEEEVTLEGIRFTVPSKEFLLATKLCDQRHKSQNDRRILLQLGCNIETAKKYQFPFPKHLTSIEAKKTNRDFL
jgi:hypothetical protein